MPCFNQLSKVGNSNMNKCSDNSQGGLLEGFVAQALDNNSPDLLVYFGNLLRAEDKEPRAELMSRISNCVRNGRLPIDVGQNQMLFVTRPKLLSISNQWLLITIATDDTDSAGRKSPILCLFSNSSYNRNSCGTSDSTKTSNDNIQRTIDQVSSIAHQNGRNITKIAIIELEKVLRASPLARRCRISTCMSIIALLLSLTVIMGWLFLR
jgi:hypothetical protein